VFGSAKTEVWNECFAPAMEVRIAVESCIHTGKAELCVQPKKVQELKDALLRLMLFFEMHIC